jgi:hypothetical protein
VARCGRKRQRKTESSVFSFSEAPNAYVFNPADAVAEMRQRRSDVRKTPTSCGNICGSNVKQGPKRKLHGQYNVAAYRRAIARACDLAFPVPVDILGEKVKANA